MRGGVRAFTRNAPAWIGLLALAACGSEGPETGVSVVDTLTNGAVRVRNTAEGLWRAEGRAPWLLIEELRIGAVDGETPYVFGSIGQIVPASDGRFWVMDGGASELRQYDAEGGFLRAIGRRGEGPGEFSGHSCAFPGPDGEVWVEDALARWQRFDDAGNLLGSLRRASLLHCGIRRWTQDGRFFVVSPDLDPELRESVSRWVVYRFDAAGSLMPTDTLRRSRPPDVAMVTWLAPNGRFRIQDMLPFTHRPNWVLDASGHFWATDGGGAYSIRRESPHGDTTLVVERTYEPTVVPDSIRQAAIDGFRREGMIQEDGPDLGDTPRTYPPFEGYFVGTDGTLWVTRKVAGGSTGLDVFSADGTYLGQASAPSDFGSMFVHHAGPDYLFAEYNDDLGVGYVVRLRIQRPEG